MILKDNDPDMWRFYHDKCKRDENIRESINNQNKRLLQLEESIAPDVDELKATILDSSAKETVQVQYGTKNRDELFMSKLIPIQFDFRGK